MFFRLSTDGIRSEYDVRGLYGGPTATPCWLIGGGPSLKTVDVGRILASPAPRFAVNLAGTGLIRPNFWTSYDPTARFHRSIYLDGSILKFVDRCRATDLVPESTYKVCDCPGMLFFERNRDLGFHNLLSAYNEQVIDWQDSMIQAIHIAYLLGFRTLYLTGCDLQIPPTPELQQLAKQRGVEYVDRELLGDFVKRCESVGIERSRMETAMQGGQYHFDESKSLSAAIQTDFHYFRVAQYLRLSRRALAEAGLNLVSLTAKSRLNDDFPQLSIDAAIDQIHSVTGNPDHESPRGLYTEQRDRRQPQLGPMRDFRPHFWEKSPPAQPDQQPQQRPNPFDQLPEVCVDIRENP